MTVTDTVAGLALKLWGGAAALDWEKFKIAATDHLTPLGYKLVYTSHYHKKALQASYKEWFGDPEKRLLVPCLLTEPTDTPQEVADEKKFEDCDQNIYCEHKGIKHVELAQALVQSYDNMPVCLCEFDQHYSASPKGVTSRLAIYLTVVAEHGKHGNIVKELYETLDRLPKLHPRFKHHHNDTCEDRTPPGLLQFRNADNEPTDAWLLTAVASFDWVEPEPTPAVPTDHPKWHPPQSEAEKKPQTFIDQIAAVITGFFRLFTG